MLCAFFELRYHTDVNLDDPRRCPFFAYSLSPNDAKARTRMPTGDDKAGEAMLELLALSHPSTF